MDTRRTGGASRALAAVAIISLTGTLALASPASAGHKQGWGTPDVTVVADGLLNPRGVDVAVNGSVFVAEAGVGGGELVEALVEGEPGYTCVGSTGRVTEVDRRGRTRHHTGFPSQAEAAGTETDPVCDDTVGFAATGPHDVATLGVGRVAVSIGLGGNLATREAVGDRFGTVELLTRWGAPRTLADLTAYEEANNPDDEIPDSNPYGIAFHGAQLYAVDAGGNDLLRVRPFRRISTVATFGRLADTTVPDLSCGPIPGFPPSGTPIPAQAVPTAIDIHRGAAYVGFLTGFPFAPGSASIAKVDLRTGAVTTVADGLSAVVGLDVGADGTIYAVEIAENGLLEGEICGDLEGRLIEVKRGKVSEIPVPGLVAPGGVAVARDGTIYVTNYSIFPGGGQLLKISR